MFKKVKIMFFGMLLSVITLFSSVEPTAVFAADKSEMVENPINISDNVVSNTDNIMPLSSRIYWGKFTFTNNNWGAYHTVYGNRMRYIIAFRNSAIDSQTTSVSLYTACMQYGGKRMAYRYCHAGGTSTFDSEGYGYYYSDWFNITSGVDYQLYYDAFTAGGGGNGNYRSADVKVWIETE